MEEIYYSLDKDLTIGDNIRGAIKTLNFTTRSDYGTASPLLDGWVQQKLNNPIGTNIRPDVVSIGKVTNVTDYTTITDPVYVSWDYLNGVLRVNYIAGLKASTKYEIKLLIF
jgi:hypothetical protein